jgi:hypothetical protein
MVMVAQAPYRTDCGRSTVSSTTKPAGMTNPELQVMVEQALGLRVVRVGRSHEYTTGIQVQHLDKEGNVKSVGPGSDLHLQMFTLLCTPQTEWEG